MSSDRIIGARTAHLESEKIALTPALARLSTPLESRHASHHAAGMGDAAAELSRLPELQTPYTVLGIASPMRPYRAVDADDRKPIEAALRLSRNNKSRAAQWLGMTLRQLSYRMKILAIGLPERIPESTN